MTFTPTFHFVCHHCGKAFDLTGERISQRAEWVTDLEELGEALISSEDAVLETAECLEDTCKGCMSIHHKQAAQEADRQAEEDMK